MKLCTNISQNPQMILKLNGKPFFIVGYAMKEEIGVFRFCISKKHKVYCIIKHPNGYQLKCV